ncbi:hypothetical protein [Streptomyces sp. NPDC014006]
MPFPLHLLSMAVFAMGASKFMLAGLLPNAATDSRATARTSPVSTPGTS